MALNIATTEINGSFYRTPSLEAVQAWRDGTPPDFVFAWKASADSIALMEIRLKVLGPKLARSCSSCRRGSKSIATASGGS